MATMILQDDDHNFWSKLMGNDEDAGMYQYSYGEGPGCETRRVIGEFINPGETVLDVGCGAGWNYEHFRDYGPKIGVYKGTDYSKRFVRACKTKYPDVLFEQQDCRDLQEEDSSWDVVILQDVLEHTNGYERPVLEALRVAKKRVIISFWHLTETDDHINHDGDEGYGAWYSRPKWEAFLNSLVHVWFDAETSPEANRQHKFYIIDKEL